MGKPRMTLREFGHVRMWLGRYAGFCAYHSDFDACLCELYQMRAASNFWSSRT